MIIKTPTRSLCNTCYKEVPAVVSTNHAGVFMKKICSEHGEQSGVVEHDPLFYTWINSMKYPSIYDGYFVDVTRKCNLRCKYCFYALQTEDPPGEYDIPRLVQECMVNVDKAPFIITGGEPTTRPDIVEVLAAIKRVGPVELLTNGVLMARDSVLLGQIFDVIANQDSRTVNLNLSVHPQTQAWREVLEYASVLGYTVESVLIVVDSEDEFRQALEIVETHKEQVMMWRIKAASKIWAEQKPEKKIFVSDMLRWLDQAGGWDLIKQRHNKTSIVNVAYKGSHIMPVSWYDTSNVDLNDINCAPYYRARNGQVENFVTASLINEGMEKGWLHGRKINED